MKRVFLLLLLFVFCLNETSAQQVAPPKAITASTSFGMYFPTNRSVKFGGLDFNFQLDKKSFIGLDLTVGIDRYSNRIYDVQGTLIYQLESRLIHGSVMPYFRRDVIAINGWKFYTELGYRVFLSEGERSEIFEAGYGTEYLDDFEHHPWFGLGTSNRITEKMQFQTEIGYGYSREDPLSASFLWNVGLGFQLN